MFKDNNGNFVDSTGDGGDSAMILGMFNLFSDEKDPMTHYVTFDDLLRRHPHQEPWDNPYNVSRDQLIPFCAGLWAMELTRLMRSIFWAHVRRFGLCINMQRDYPGSWKYPFPHFYTDRTENNAVKFKLFDFPDLLSPIDICFLFVCCRYNFPLLNRLCCKIVIINLWINSLLRSEINQPLCQAVVTENKELFKKLRPTWKFHIDLYWLIDRNDNEMADLIVNGMKS